MYYDHALRISCDIVPTKLPTANMYIMWQNLVELTDSDDFRRYVIIKIARTKTVQCT